MTFERRDFIKAGTAGLVAGFMKPGLAGAQSSSGEFEGGTGAVHLEGRLKSGVLKIKARDFVEGTDRSLIINGELNSVALYCAMFSYNHDGTVFAILRDHDHATTLVISDTDDPKTGRLLVWNDAAAPETFRIDKDKFMDTENAKASVLDGRGEVLDLVGKRKPPDFGLKELEEVFGDNPALKEFMRGNRSTHHSLTGDKFNLWICRFLCTLPGSLFPLFWAAG